MMNDFVFYTLYTQRQQELRREAQRRGGYVEGRAPSGLGPARRLWLRLRQSFGVAGAAQPATPVGRVPADGVPAARIAAHLPASGAPTQVSVPVTEREAA